MSHVNFGNGAKLKKTLLTSEEKAHIVAEMRSIPHPVSTMAWSVKFGRLPATIRKIAAEHEIALYD